MNKSIWKRRTISLAVVCASLFWTPAKAETLTQALASAYNHSGLLEQNRALLRAADEEVAITLAALRPILSYSGQVQRQFGSTFSSTFLTAVPIAQNDASLSVTASLLLYDGGASRLAMDAAKESVLATRQQLVSVEQSVLLRAATAYIAVLRDSETVQLRRNNLKLLQEELRAAQNRFDVGEVTRTDVALAEAQVAAARANLSGAIGALDISREEYAAAIGHKPGRLAGISKLPALERKEERAKSLALQRHPDLRAAQFDANVAEINIKRANAARNPTVTLQGSLTTQQRFDSEQFTDSGTVGVNVQGPIYRGGELSARTRQAMAQRDASRSNLHVVSHNIRQNVGNAIAQLAVTEASIVATREQIRAAEVAFRGVREEAQLGQRTTLDVLTAEQDLLDARTQLTSAVADRNAAAFQLLSAQGLMTAEHLRLPVQRYDPTEYYNLIKTAPVTQSRQGDQLDRVLKSLGKE